MNSRIRDIAGQRFGKLVATSFSHVGIYGAIWNVKCDCGEEAKKRSSKLISGHTKSCGCLVREAPTTHGKSRSSLYKIWDGMRQRCTNPNAISYKYYGGRGIKICARWLKFEAFLEDMGERPKKLSLERRDNNGNYEPDNCYWATSKEQQRNTRRNRLIDHNGTTKTLAEWSEVSQINYHTLRMRLVNGWTMEKSLTEPVRVMTP